MVGRGLLMVQRKRGLDALPALRLAWLLARPFLLLFCEVQSHPTAQTVGGGTPVARQSLELEAVIDKAPQAAPELEAVAGLALIIIIIQESHHHPS